MTEEEKLRKQNKGLIRSREDNVWTTNGHNAFENVIRWCEEPIYTEE